MALTYIHEGVAKVLLCPQRLDQALRTPPCTLYGKMIAFEGNLFNNQGLNVKLLNDFFSLVGNQLLVPTVQVIQTAVAADDNTEMLGPYVAGDASTKIVRVEKIIPIPCKYVNLFLANDVTPKIFFNTIYPQIVIDSTKTDCAAFITIF